MNGFDDFSGFMDGFDNYNDVYRSAYAGAYMAASVISAIISIAAIVLTIIALWKIFEKAGKPGWHAIIPFLNIYDLFQISWKRKMGVATIVLEACGIGAMLLDMFILAMSYGSSYMGYMFGLDYGRDSIDRFVSNINGSAAVWVLMVGAASIVLLIAAIFSIIAHIKLGQAFGKSGGFLVGMFFVPIVFLCILAFGKAQYQGHWEKEGFVPDGPNGMGPQGNVPPVNPTPINPTPTDATAEAPRYCSGCGTVITPGSKFCANCGKQFEKTV